MPELPEVETIRKDLIKIEGLKISKVQNINSSLLKDFNENYIKKIIEQKEIKKVWRHGKYLIINLGNNSIVLHLRMTGQILLGNDFILPDKHMLLCLKLSNNEELRFYDFRKFGTMDILKTNNVTSFLRGKTGVDALSNDFNINYFFKKIQGSKQNVKAFLLNQKNVAGIGNIYADEALYKAHILPTRKIDSLTAEEIKKLFQAINSILEKGIKYGGSSVSDYYHVDGTRGTMQEYLMVYGRGGEKCKFCNNKLIKTKIAGRGTVYCETCQY